MKRIWSAALLLALVAVAFLAGVWVSWRASGRAEGPGTRKVLYWVDPMHPTYKSDKPGIAPDCGMALEPVYAAGPTVAPGSSHAQCTVTSPCVTAPMSLGVLPGGTGSSGYWYFNSFSEKVMPFAKRIVSAPASGTLQNNRAISKPGFRCLSALDFKSLPALSMVVFSRMQVSTSCNGRRSG